LQTAVGAPGSPWSDGQPRQGLRTRRQVRGAG